MKKIIFMICGLLVLFIVIAFFKPVIPMKWNTDGILFGYPYQATRNHIYYNTPNLVTESGEIEKESILISGATIWNSKMLGLSLVTPTAVYNDGGLQLIGADPATYVDVEFTMNESRFYSSSIPAFGYDKNNLYVGGKTIPLTGDRQPFVAYNKYIKSL